MSRGILFLIGAGASVDSGLPTYRGEGGTSQNPESILDVHNDLAVIWQFLAPLYQKIKDSVPGETYALIKELGEKYPDSLIVNQNIDGHAQSTGIPVIELHGNHSTMTCRNSNCRKQAPSNPEDYFCTTCGDFCRPDIVLYGEAISTKKLQEVYSHLKKRPELMLVIGTSRSLPYLDRIIEKAKMRGVRICHINPDPEYSVSGRDVWYRKTASEGLQLFLESWRKDKEE